MIRKASAQWNGDLKSGKGTFTSSSGVFKDLPYSWTQRFENTPGLATYFAALKSLACGSLHRRTLRILRRRPRISQRLL